MDTRVHKVFSLTIAEVLFTDNGTKFLYQPIIKNNNWNQAHTLFQTVLKVLPALLLNIKLGEAVTAFK